MLRRAFTLLVLLPLLGGQLGACTGWLFDDEEQPTTVSALPPAEDEEYPDLSSVPDEAPLPSSRVQRLDLAQDLASDRDNARYTDETLTNEQAAQAQDPVSAQGAPPPDIAGAGGIAVLREDTAEVAELPDTGDLPPPPQMPGDSASAAQSGASGASQGTAPPPPAVQAESMPTPPVPGQSPYETQMQGEAPAQAGYNPPMLLQQQAMRQQALEAQQLQSMAAQQQAYAEQARQEAIQQQMIRQQVIDQGSWQRLGMQYLQAPQMAAVPPVGAIAPVPPQPSPSNVVAPGYGSGYPGPVAAGASGPGYGATPAFASGPGGPGQLVGLIYFGHGSTVLSGQDKAVLRKVVELQNQSGRPIRVVGHASARTGVVDPVQHQMANFDVSMSRANAVADELYRMGARREAVAVMARGDAEPVYHEFMPTGEAGNRRVEIFIQ